MEVTPKGLKNITRQPGMRHKPLLSALNRRRRQMDLSKFKNRLVYIVSDLQDSQGYKHGVLSQKASKQTKPLHNLKNCHQVCKERTPWGYLKGVVLQKRGGNNTPASQWYQRMLPHLGSVSFLMEVPSNPPMNSRHQAKWGRDS